MLPGHQWGQLNLPDELRIYSNKSAKSSFEIEWKKYQFTRFFFYITPRRIKRVSVQHVVHHRDLEVHHS